MQDGGVAAVVKRVPLVTRIAAKRYARPAGTTKDLAARASLQRPLSAEPRALRSLEYAIPGGTRLTDWGAPPISATDWAEALICANGGPGCRSGTLKPCTFSM